MEEWYLAALVFGVLSFVAGVLFGASAERKAWKTRAMPRNDTPHYCDGVFYYVIPEELFIKHFRAVHPGESGEKE